MADVAILAAGCVTVPTHTTHPERDHRDIWGNACAKAVFVSTPKLAQALLPAVVQSSECRTVIGFEPLRIGPQSDLMLCDLRSLIDRHPADVEQAAPAAAAFLREDLASTTYDRTTVMYGKSLQVLVTISGVRNSLKNIKK